jgi:TPR repeat protein
MQKDMKAALHWYKKAALQGHKEAKKRLGELGY